MKRPPVFIIGCGRSGTTILGDVLSRHPELFVMNEPYDRWAAIDFRTDCLNLYTKKPGTYTFMDDSMVTAELRKRFTAAMQPPSSRLLVEKSPTNTLRVGYLEALAPESLYIHIVRNGYDVAHSIAKKAEHTVGYWGRPDYNAWWGSGDIKWSLLTRDAENAGYLPSSDDWNDAQRGLYEWMLSLGEVERWRDRLGDRMIEIRYQDLLSDPVAVLGKSIAPHLGVAVPSEWVEEASKMLRPPNTKLVEKISISTPIADEVERYHQQYDV